MPGIVLAILVGLGVSQLGLYLTTVVLHRALSHRALRLSAPVWFVCRVLIWLVTGIRPRQWVAVHRKHHAFTDVEGDPHSPVLEGFWAVQLANVAMYRRVARDPSTVARYARDLPADRWDRILFDHAFVGLGLGIGLLCLALGWQLGLVAAGVHAVSYLMASGAINAIGHTRGRRPYDNLATNNQWLALLVAGEGLHNNHHAAPTSARLALGRGEIDPAWWLIAAGRRLRLLSVRHDSPHIRSAQPPSPEPELV